MNTELESHATGSKAAPSTGSEMVKHLPLHKKALQGGCLLPTSDRLTGLRMLLPCAVVHKTQGIGLTPPVSMRSKLSSVSFVTVLLSLLPALGDSTCPMAMLI